MWDACWEVPGLKTQEVMTANQVQCSNCKQVMGMMWLKGQEGYVDYLCKSCLKKMYPDIAIFDYDTYEKIRNR